MQCIQHSRDNYCDTVLYECMTDTDADIHVDTCNPVWGSAHPPLSLSIPYTCSKPTLIYIHYNLFKLFKFNHYSKQTKLRKVKANSHTYPSKVRNGINVTFILFHFLSVSYDLFNFQRIHIFGPAAFNMVHPACFCLKPFCIYLQTSKYVSAD